MLLVVAKEKSLHYCSCNLHRYYLKLAKLIMPSQAASLALLSLNIRCVLTIDLVWTQFLQLGR